MTTGTSVGAGHGNDIVSSLSSAFALPSAFRTLTVPQIELEQAFSGRSEPGSLADGSPSPWDISDRLLRSTCPLSLLPSRWPYGECGGMGQLLFLLCFCWRCRVSMFVFYGQLRRRSRMHTCQIKYQEPGSLLNTKIREASGAVCPILRLSFRGTSDPFHWAWESFWNYVHL